MGDADGQAPVHGIGEPSLRPPGRRMRRLACGGLAVAIGAAVTACLLMAHQPAFYRRRVAVGVDDEARARRLVSRASALQADLLRPGPWGAAIGERELNAWLATDLPRNHAGMLPPWISEPRVAFTPRRIAAGYRQAVGPFSWIASCEAEVVLRDVNQLVVAVRRVRLGGLPIPPGPMVRALERQCKALGLPTELRRLDGGTALVVYIPPIREAGAPNRRLESFAVGQGELLAAGVVGAAAAPGR